MEAKRCCNRVYGSGRSFGGSPCANKAKVERDGKHYCTVHDPVRVKEKSDARTAKWQAQWAKERTEREEAAALKVEMQRRYDCHDALVEALKAALTRFGDMNGQVSAEVWNDNWPAIKVCRESLALAGETP